MKQKKKISFLLGVVLVISALIGFGGIPAVSNAVTSASNQTNTAVLNTQLIQVLMEMIRQLQAQLQQLIAAQNTTAIQCGWCGNSCINWAGKDRSSIACNDVMPPTGSYCQNVNGTCQVTTSATKYSCSTAMGTISSNNYTGCIPSSNGTFNSLAECQSSCPVTTACITEGRSISLTPVGFTQRCCSGLVLCSPPTGSLGSMGTCQKTCTTVPATCTDSDGGQNFYVNGLVTGTWCTNGACTGPIFNDTCLSSSVLQEQYCDTNNNHQSVTYTCPNGCDNGACKPITVLTTKPASTISCTDTDGGDAAYQKGTITIKTTAGGQWSYTDYCQSSTAVQEYNCLDNPNTYPDSNAMSAYKLSSHNCGVGEVCYDGACKIMGSYLRPPCGNYGDTDLDGYVTSADTEIVANYAIMLPRLATEQQLRADVNGDGVVNYLDTQLMSRYVSRLDTTFPVCTPKTPSSCSWCGNICVLSSTLAGKTCANVMPPTNSTCTLVNGICTSSNGGVVEGVETHIFSENLGYGVENEDVKALQSILTAKGYFSGIISGYFGWQTEEAVKAFQLSNNLPATGIVGPLTRGLLNK